MRVEEPLSRGLPQNEEAERTLLGAILVDNENLYAALENVGEDDFYRDGHKKIFAHMRALAERSEPIDLVILKNELAKAGELDAVGGIAFVSVLRRWRSARRQRWALQPHRAREVGLLRQMIRSAQTIMEECSAEGSTTEELVDQAEQKIFEISDKRLRTGFASFKDVAKGTLAILEQFKTRGGAITGVATGYRRLDELTAGFQPGNLVILAARPAMGKTSFALDVCRNVAKAGGTVGIFSLEMTKEQLALRMLCAEASVNSHQLRTGYATERDWERLATAMGQLAASAIHIDDSASASVLEMKAKCRRLKSEGSLSAVVVDYLQLMRGVGKFENRQLEIASISRGLKGLAKELGVPVLALSQLSRASESRKDHRPQLADLRESGAIEQDADIVLFIYRDEVYERTEENHGLAEIIIGKQRNGPIDTVELAFLEDFPRFENLEWRSD